MESGDRGLAMLFFYSMVAAGILGLALLGGLGTLVYLLLI